MFSFLRPQSELAVVYDIGSSSVGAGLARIAADSPAEIVYAVRESIPHQKKLDPSRLLKDMKSALAKANSSVAKEGLSRLKLEDPSDARVQHVALGFSAPWTSSRTQVVAYSKDKPFTFTREMADKLLADAEGKARTVPAGLSAIEKRIISVALDGKPSLAPFGSEAKSAEVSVLASYMPTEVIDGAIEASAAAHHPQSAKAFSFPVAMFSVLRDLYHHAEDFAFLDVGGELSDLSIVRGGVMLETASFPFGRNSISRKISDAFAVSAVEADSLTNLYLDKRLSALIEEKLRPIVDKAASEWLGAFKAALARISGENGAPAEVFILSDDSFDRFCARLLVRKDLSVIEVGADKLAPLAVFSSGTRKDPALAVAAALVSKTSRLDIK